MTDATTRIRNLAVALEAVYNMTTGAGLIFEELQALLALEVQKLTEKKGLPSARPAEPTDTEPQPTKA